MKVPLFVLGLLLSGVSGAYAQVYVGPIAGGQYSWSRFDESSHYDSYDVKGHWGWHAGANFSMKVRNRFFLYTSLLYSTKGRTVEGLQDRMLTNKVRYDYLEMPIIYAVDFRARLDNGKEFKYFLGIGPNVSYWLGGKGTLYNSDLAESADFGDRQLDYTIAFREEDSEPRMNEMNVVEPNRVQLGLNFATGFVVEPLPRQRILVLLRYELGHSFLSRTSNGTFVPTYYEDVLQARNNGIRLSLSYMIDLKIEDRKRGKSTVKPNKPKRRK